MYTQRCGIGVVYETIGPPRINHAYWGCGLQDPLALTLLTAKTEPLTLLVNGRGPCTVAMDSPGGTTYNATV